MYISELKKYVVAAKLQNNVEFCGYSAHTENYYRDADITLVCSAAEAFGRVTVEALLSGTLVIGKSTAGTRELLCNGENGLLYDDVNDLACQIKTAMDYPVQMRILAETGRSYMMDNMTAEVNAERINSLYINALS